MGSTFNQMITVLALTVKKSLMKGRNRPSQEQRVGKAVGATLRHPSACSVPAIALRFSPPREGWRVGRVSKRA